ncbi:hypothetical protein AAC387_Pa11g0684 [Persea americana]
MAALLTITFDENKYQVMLQEKQSKLTFKRPASYRSVTSLGNSQNTGSTSTPRTIVFGSLGPFPLPIEETVPTKKQKTAPQRVAASTPKAVTKKPEARGNPTRPQPTKKPGLPQDLVPTIFTKTKKVPDICKASIPGSSQGEPAKDRVQILSMPVFKEDKLGCCARGTTSFIARAQPELTEAQIARRIHRRAPYQQKRLGKQRTQHSELQVSQKWVEKEAPDQVAAVHMVVKTKRRHKSATKIHVKRLATHSVSRMIRHQEDSPTPSSQGQ